MVASSSHYYNLYKKKKKEVQDYEDDLKELNKIEENLLYNLYDEIRSINNEIDGLKEDLNNGVRHNSLFARRIYNFENEKEKSIGLDCYLSKSKDALEDEISRINSLKYQASLDRDYYYRKYKEKEAEEKAASAEKLF